MRLLLLLLLLLLGEEEILFLDLDQNADHAEI